MNQSEHVNELAGALAKAQGMIKGAIRDSINPHFKSPYADLESVWDAIRGPFSANGLAIVQTTHLLDGATVLRTVILHTSGQWIAGDYPVLAERAGPQALGSAITYARRYAVAAAAGVTQTDDDGEGAERAPKPTAKPSPPPPPKSPPAPKEPAKKLNLVLPGKPAEPEATAPEAKAPPPFEVREASPKTVNLGDKYTAIPVQKFWLVDLGKAAGVPIKDNEKFYIKLSERCEGVVLKDIPAILNRMIEEG